MAPKRKSQKEETKHTKVDRRDSERIGRAEAGSSEADDSSAAAMICSGDVSFRENHQQASEEECENSFFLGSDGRTFAATRFPSVQHFIPAPHAPDPVSSQPQQPPLLASTDTYPGYLELALDTHPNLQRGSKLISSTVLFFAKALSLNNMAEDNAFPNSGIHVQRKARPVYSFPVGEPPPDTPLAQQDIAHVGPQPILSTHNGNDLPSLLVERDDGPENTVRRFVSLHEDLSLVMERSGEALSLLEIVTDPERSTNGENDQASSESYSASDPHDGGHAVESERSMCLHTCLHSPMAMDSDLRSFSVDSAYDSVIVF